MAALPDSGAPAQPERLSGNPRGVTRRLRDEAAARLSLPCRLEFGNQTEFPEPPVRINTDLLDAERLAWSETQAWDEFAEFYATGGSR